MIDANFILKTDLLDLLFDGRNKQYGAYELRRKYNKRMTIAVTVMISCCLLFFLLFVFGTGNKRAGGFIVVDTVKLIDVTDEPKKPEVIPPPPKQVQPQIKMRQYTAFVLTHDDVKPDEKPPVIDDLEDSKIGKINVDGEKFDDVVAPPISDNKGVIDAPKQKEEEDWEKTFLSVEIESEYPGGIESWKRFLGKNLNYPVDAVEKEIEGTVLVQFIVDKEGNVSDVTAVSGPNELRAEAERVIKKSGKWTAASQNGRKVKSYKRQPIIFRLDR